MDSTRGQPRTDPDPTDQDTRSKVLTVVRMGFLVLMLTVPLLTVIQFQTGDTAQVQFFNAWWWMPIVISVVMSAIFLAADLLIPRKKISTLAGVMLGLLAGLLAAVALGFVVDVIAESWDLTTVPTFVFMIKVLLGISMCYMGISTVLQTQDDFRLVIPYVEFAKQMRGVRPLLLDTSSLIDARIVEVAETGISQSPIIIPQFVVEELHRLADSVDRLKRARGRRGLDIVAKLQRSHLLDVSIDESPMPSKAVDHMLVDLAKQLPAVIVTTDVGLRQVATIHGVVVLNLNDLANALKPNVIPGEQLQVQLIRRGEHQTQGVGYLPDGTMVVAEDGVGHIGEEVSLTVTRSLQTSAGRMIFGHLEAEHNDDPLPSPQAADTTAMRPPASPSSSDSSDAAPPPGAESVADEASRASASPPATPDAEPPRGPYPPKPPVRTNRARNPRR